MKRITSILILLVAMMVTFPMNTSAQRRMHKFYFDIILDNANNKQNFKAYASFNIGDMQDVYKGKKRDINDNCDLMVLDPYGEMFFNCPVLSNKEVFKVFLCNTVGYDEEENSVVFCDVSKRYYFIVTQYKGFPAMKLYDKRVNKYWTFYTENSDRFPMSTQRSYDNLMSIVKANNFHSYKIIKAKTSDILKKNLLK